MVFLLLQISLLLLFAALLGALAVYLWMRGRYEDVSESYQALIGRGDGVTKDDLNAGLSVLTGAIDRLPRADFAPVVERIGGLEDRLSAAGAAEPDLSPVYERLNAIEQRVAAGFATSRGPDVLPLQRGVDALAAKIDALPEPDLEPLAARLEKVETVLDAALGAERPDPVDLGPLARRFEDLAGAIRAARSTDDERLSALTNSIAQIRPPSLASVEARLGALEKALREAPKPDFAPVMTSVSSSLGAVEKRVEDRLAKVEAAVRAAPQPDLAPVVRTVRALDARLDFVALENRLTAIEYGLAAAHHMLRGRGDGAALAAFEELTTGDDVPEAGGAGNGAAGDKAQAGPQSAKRAGPVPNLLTHPAFGGADELTRINGVGPMVQEMLNNIGVFYFWQIADWSASDAGAADRLLRHFHGRIEEEDWIGQARAFAAAPDAASRPAPSAS
ncbi:MAG: hypothetical protein AAGC56_13375 [Pseudomonadota bacterium]